jgi:hypothetical protein
MLSFTHFYQASAATTGAVAGVVAFLAGVAVALAAGAAAAYKILVVVALGLAVPTFDTKQ